MRPLIIGNWKLNPITSRDAKALFLAVRKKLRKDMAAQVAIAPPYPFIADLSRLSPSGRVALAAQDVFYEDQGPFTGEVSAPMLASLGVSYLIIGHSERRALGERDEEVRRKLEAALRRKLMPIVCVGERERDSAGNFYSLIEAQVRTAIDSLSPRQLSQLTLAYEPVWAIGTGKNATPEDVKEMQLFIASVLAKRFDRKLAEKVRIIYGGSVTGKNARALYLDGGMRGFLVGGASLRAEEFIDIVKATL